VTDEELTELARRVWPSWPEFHDGERVRLELAEELAVVRVYYPNEQGNGWGEAIAIQHPRAREMLAAALRAAVDADYYQRNYEHADRAREEELAQLRIELIAAQRKIEKVGSRLRSHLGTWNQRANLLSYRTDTAGVAMLNAYVTCVADIEVLLKELEGSEHADRERPDAADAKLKQIAELADKWREMARSEANDLYGGDPAVVVARKRCAHEVHEVLAGKVPP
jgi:hypothetical protein